LLSWGVKGLNVSSDYFDVWCATCVPCRIHIEIGTPFLRSESFFYHALCNILLYLNELSVSSSNSSHAYTNYHKASIFSVCLHHRKCCPIAHVMQGQEMTKKLRLCCCLKKPGVLFFT